MTKELLSDVVEALRDLLGTAKAWNDYYDGPGADDDNEFSIRWKGVLAKCEEELKVLCAGQ